MFRAIKSLSYPNFSSFSVSYWPRASNKVVDALALYGAKMVLVPQIVWPDRVWHDLVDNDLAERFGLWNREFHLKKKSC